MRFILLAVLLAAPVSGFAETYKWVGEKGQIGYSDDLGRVPKKFRDKAVATEKQEQAVEIIEKSEPEKSPRKGGDANAGQVVAGDEQSKGKGSVLLFDGKDGAAWKLEFARLKHEVKSLEDQATGIKERIADTGKISRGEYLTLQSTRRDLDVRIGKARKKLEALNDAAEKAGVSGEFR